MGTIMEEAIKKAMEILIKEHDFIEKNAPELIAHMASIRPDVFLKAVAILKGEDLDFDDKKWDEHPMDKVDFAKALDIHIEKIFPDEHSIRRIKELEETAMKAKEEMTKYGSAFMHLDFEKPKFISPVDIDKKSLGIMSSAMDDRIKRFISAGRFIEAIKMKREYTGMGLKEAKESVENMRADMLKMSDCMNCIVGRSSPGGCPVMPSRGVNGLFGRLW